MAAPQSALERKKWKKFGNAVTQEPGITMQSKEEIPFEKTRVKQKTDQEKKTADLQSALATSDKSAIVGRSGPRMHHHSGSSSP